MSLRAAPLDVTKPSRYTGTRKNTTRASVGRATCRCGLVRLGMSGRASRPRTARQAGWLRSCAWHFVRRLQPTTRFPAPLCTTLTLTLALTTQRRLGRVARHSEWAGGRSYRAIKGRTDGSRSRARASRPSLRLLTLALSLTLPRTLTREPEGRSPARSDAKPERSEGRGRHAARSRESDTETTRWGWAGGWNSNAVAPVPALPRPAQRTLTTTAVMLSRPPREFAIATKRCAAPLGPMPITSGISWSCR